ncbi:hypothetical protein EXVG_00014 [Emiliania huxleyi virus 202]|nr:hypothetical protein EXVG_00014 [Emiliania huxleyi virus 202]AHA54540.1 putative membrane protein [Emiliania huxleyi virus 18]AHA55579.1 putative membrane protein [Emiliania huxleyi virus 156]
MKFHKVLIIPFTRRILWFMMVFIITYLLWELAEVDWPIIAVILLTFVAYEAGTYDPKKAPFIPGIITK